jgi:hypothetical protein
LPARIERWELAAIGLLLAWFAARIAWLSFQIHPFVPPDEVTHFGRVLVHAGVWGVPEDGPGTYQLGLVSRGPWLYYWVVARALSLNVFPLPDLVFARLVNGVLGLATAAIAILWLRDWCRSVWARLLFAVLVTNTLMLTGLAGSVSYDNGGNLLAAAALLAFTRFRSSRRSEWLLAFAAFALAGVLAKRTLLPLAFLLVLLLVWRERRDLRAWPAQAVAAWRSASAGWLALLATVVVLGGFALALYGGNLARYGRLLPDFDQVVGVDNAMQNRIFARGRILEQFRAGELTIHEARESASRIRHMGDRGDTLFLLKAAQLPESSVVGRLAYVPEWGRGMLTTSVGYLGHRRALRSNPSLAGYALILAAAAAAIAWRWRPGAARGVPADAAFLVFGYAFVLMWLVHYPSYQSSRYIELALQGRYLFPVLVPLYGLVAWALGELIPGRVRPFVVAAVALFYLYGDLPWLLQQIDDRWLMPR